MQQNANVSEVLKVNWDHLFWLVISENLPPWSILFAFLPYFSAPPNTLSTLC